MIGRVVLGLATILVIAWLTVMLRDVLLIRQATRAPNLAAFYAEVKTAAGLRARNDELRQARLLNPDLGPRLRIASDLQLYGGATAVAKGLQIALSVTRAEPDNLSAWYVLLGLEGAAGNPGGIADARQEILRLDPPAR